MNAELSREFLKGFGGRSLTYISDLVAISLPASECFAQTPKRRFSDKRGRGSLRLGALGGRRGALRRSATEMTLPNFVLRNFLLSWGLNRYVRVVGR